MSKVKIASIDFQREFSLRLKGHKGLKPGKTYTVNAELHDVLVTSYEYADLDGTACAYAYSEFLNKTGKNAKVTIFETPHREARFVMDYFKIKINNANNFMKTDPDIILVDASELYHISKEINPKRVVEIIDHRKVNESEKFPNAKIQIEFVGAAATLIAEKFYKNKTEMSRESAALLYSAIVSNTINFMSKLTTSRDRKMANWLLTKIKIPQNYIHKMFLAKSKFEESVDCILDEDMAVSKFGTKKIVIMQLEIIGVESFVKNNITEIEEYIKKNKIKKKLDFIFLSCIDLEKEINEFVAIDINTKSLLSRTLKTNFNGNIALRSGIIMRKEIVPKIKEAIENQTVPFYSSPIK